MGSQKDEILIRFDWKHVIAFILFMMLTIFTLVSYVNAMVTFRPSTVSQYAPPPITNIPPIAEAGSDQEVFVNQTVYFDGSGSQDSDGTLITFLWSFDDGESATGESVSHKYATAGVYDVTLTVTDDDGAVNSDVITVTVRQPTPELIGPLSPEDAADILEGIEIEAALDIIVNLNLSDAAEIAQALNMTTLMEMVEAAINLNQTDDISEVLLEMDLENVTEVLLGLDPALSAQILESMTEFNSTKRNLIIENSFSVDENSTARILGQIDAELLPEILIETEDDFAAIVMFELNASSGVQVLETMIGLNITKSALVLEAMVSIDNNGTAAILELMETETLLEVLVEISQLPSSPSMVATIIESLSVEKAVELTKAWISTAHIQELGIVWEFLSQEALDSIFGGLTMEERSSVYPYLTSEVVSMIQSELLPLPDVTVTSISVTKVDGRAYQLNGTVENQGNTESGFFVADLLIDDELVEQLQVSSLEPWETATFSYEWKPRSMGAYSLEAIADTANLIEETDETNNVFTRTYGVELPDLTVAFTTTPEDYVRGESYTLSVEVANIGEEEAINFDLTVDGTGIIVEDGDVRYISVDVGSSDIEKLPPGSTETFDFSWTPEVAGAYTMQARADTQGLLLEGVKENNEAELQLEVAKKPSNWIYLLTASGVAAAAAAGAIYLYRKEISNLLSRYVEF